MNIEIKKPQQFALLTVLITVSIAYGLLQSPEYSGSQVIDAENRTEAIEIKSEEFERARPVKDPQGFINADNVSIENNIGEKVILLDMWTYSCINCQRTFPHLKEWNRKYGDEGLLIIGNHAPEFGFEKNRENVEAAVDRFNLTYPIVLDNNHGTWNAYNNRYWPQKYLIGVDGFVRYEHIGEGSYQETERKIRQLLRELKQRKGEDPTLDVNETPDFAEDEHDSSDVNAALVRTPEIYFGALRNKRLENGIRYRIGEQSFDIPDQIKEDLLYLGGEWSINREFARARENGSIKIKYGAKNVNMVLDGEEAQVKVLLDGEPIQDYSGTSIDDAVLKVDEEKLYSIVRGEDYSRHTLELEIQNGTLDAYTFTFG